MQRIRRHWKGLLAGGIVLVAALVIGIPWAYIHLVEGNQPAPLSLSSIPAGTTSAASSVAASTTPTSSTAGAEADGASALAGAWTVSSGSQAGYRVKETLAGQGVTAVGRTSAVTGSATLTGTSVSAATFTVEMAKVTSDRSQRDSKFSGEIMETSKYPTGTFVLTAPIALGSTPAVGAEFSGTATGNLTLHGTTKTVTFTLTGKRTTTNVAVTGTIDIKYGDYNIDNPSVGGFVSVGDSGTIEFLLVLAKS